MNSPRRMNAGSESVPTRALPETPPFNARASASNVWLAARILSASASRRLPAAVSVIPVDVRGQRRLADVQLLRRPSQMARFGDGSETSEAIEIHQRLHCSKWTLQQ